MQNGLLLQLEVFTAALEAAPAGTILTAFLARISDFHLEPTRLTPVDLPFLHVMTA